MSEPARIGVLGGTFDPIHLAHLALARAAMEQANLDQVLFVVSASPPHKVGDVRLDAEQRMELVQAALADEPGMLASRIEMDRGGPSYTSDTLLQLRTEQPGAALFLILGMDAVHDLPRWHRPDLIVANARILAAPRPDLPREPPAELAPYVQLLDFETRPVSSTDIRRQLAQGEWPEQLPARVRDLIEERDWYGRRRAHTSA